MGFKKLSLKHSYDSAIDDIINDFYIPTLSLSKKYDRIAGFFTSSSFAISAKGIYHILNNNGEIRMIVSPKLSKEDIDAINPKISNLDMIISKKMIQEMLLETDEVIKKHHQIMAWLINKGHLILKIALPKNRNNYFNFNEIEYSGLFHQKIGILEDNKNNVITFSGSINETFAAWTKNVEEFKVFKSWEEQQKLYCESDMNKFDLYWNDLIDNVDVRNLPNEFENKLIEIVPNDVDKIIQSIINKKPKLEYEIPLFFYQKEAMELWKKNNNIMLFEMATGTGKTRTAIACINEFLSESKDKNKIVIISTPQPTLSLQWKNEMFDLKLPYEESIIVDGSHSWRKKIDKHIFQLSTGFINNLVIFTTHDTSSILDFTDYMYMAVNNNIEIMFVGDEVHALGSKEYRKALLEIYSKRVGLSATPTRWFDQDGTEFLLEYFKNNIYQFGIDKALNTINPLTNKTFLCKYYYDIRFISLNISEIDDYIELTKKISKAYNIDNDTDENTNLKSCLLKRAKIIKSAENKYAKLQEILEEIRNDISNTLIFVDPEQMDEVKRILNKNEIRFALYTQKQDTKKRPSKYNFKTEREYIIDLFKNQKIDVLVAIRCLNEGIDIPTADKAILMSNTTNPREYIQRIGRVIRQNTNKETAIIYDLMVFVDNDDKYNKKIFQREYNRVKYIAQYSINNADAISKIMEKW